MSFINAASKVLCEKTYVLLEYFPGICEKFPAFSSIQQTGLDENQQQKLIGTIAVSAILVAGGLFSTCLKGGFPAKALFLGVATLGTFMLNTQYQLLASMIPSNHTL